MEKEKIKDLYTKENKSLREISRIFNTDHHKIKRVLLSMGVEIEKKPNPPFSDRHKENISKSCKGRKSWNKGKKASMEQVYKNMASHIRFNVSYEWFIQFEDIEKIKFLNRSISNRGKDYRFIENVDWYKSYILKFYNDKQFNILYEKWKIKKDKYLIPSIDHIIPKSKGGTNDLDNLQFLTWFENRAKNDMSQEKWNYIKNNIGEYFV